MSVKVKTSDVLWSYAAQLLQFGSGVFVLPLVLRKLPEQQLGMWYAFMAVVAFASLLDVSFQNTISVNVSYVYSGARRLIAEGFDSASVGVGIDIQAFRSLAWSVNAIYITISIIGFLGMVSFGSWYIFAISRKVYGIKYLSIAWIVMVATTTLSLYGGRYQAWLQGRGMVRYVRITTIFSRLAFLGVSVFALCQNLGLLSMSLGMAAQSVVSITLGHVFFLDKETRIYLKRESKIENLVKILFYNAKKVGTVSIGSFLINRGNVLVCAYFLSPQMTARYGLTMQFFSFLTQFSQSTFYTFIPKMNALRIEGNIEGLRRCIGVGVFVMIVLFSLGGGAIIVLGELVLGAFRSNTHILGRCALFLILVTSILEANHSIAAGALATKNEIPYVKPSIISGFLILVLSAVMAGKFGFGIWALLLSQFIIQLSYNNWKWPLMIAKDLDFKYFEVIPLGALMVFWKFMSVLKKGRRNAHS